PRLGIGPDVTPRAAIGDKGYSSKANRAVARARGIAPVIAHKATEKNKPAFFAETLYKACARSEQGIGILKRFKRVALPCEKTARNHRSIVSFAAALCSIKFVRTAPPRRGLIRICAQDRNGRRFAGYGKRSMPDARGQGDGASERLAQQPEAGVAIREDGGDAARC
ncbi:MAG: transposase, partial [Rhizobiaceae bacterium]|nr:transposase [Rhizobiaceae bacterium]